MALTFRGLSKKLTRYHHNNRDRLSIEKQTGFSEHAGGNLKLVGKQCRSSRLSWLAEADVGGPGVLVNSRGAAVRAIGAVVVVAGMRT